MVRRVYCSGPLFCPEEIASMNAIARVLEDAGFTTFLPHRDGLERYVLPFLNTPLSADILGMRDRIDRAIFALDVYQIVQQCDSFVLNMNGRVPDEGAVAEAGIAFALGKPLVIYKNDCRTAFDGRDNSMITGLSVLDPVSDRGKIPSAILEAEKILGKPRPDLPGAISGNLASIAGKGEKIWRVMGSTPVHCLGRTDILPLFREIVEISD
ncbi:MAG: nucleoside 2-deoxyribosyltransferase [Desulfobacterota bacterium]|nr:nucleoside 2-deoxyribosyltransferase [Thermodesulfobacteriota bacterium]